MSIFELTLEDTLARKNSNKIWFFTCLFVSLQAEIERKYGQDKDKRDAAQECGAAVEAD